MNNMEIINKLTSALITLLQAKATAMEARLDPNSQMVSDRIEKIREDIEQLVKDTANI